MANTIHRGFERSEFEERTQRAQKVMHQMKLDAILLTTEPNVRYFSGFHTQFWVFENLNRGDVVLSESGSRAAD